MKNRERIVVNASGRAGVGFVGVSDRPVLTDLLNDLIAMNRGIVDVYQTAANRLEIEANIKLLRGYADQHEIYLKELSNLLVSHSGNPTTSSDGGSLVKRAWVTLKAALTEGDGPILAEVVEDAKSVLEEYGQAMGVDLPEDVREVVRRHMSELRLACEKLSGLSAAYQQR